MKLGELITTVCPVCGATFENVHRTTAHVAAYHLQGLELGRMHPLSIGFNLNVVMSEDGVTELVGLRLLLQEEASTQPGAELKVFDYVEVLFTEDSCRQLAEHFTQMADPEYRRSLREAEDDGI